MIKYLDNICIMWQLKILSLVKGAGNALFSIKELESCFSQLLRRHSESGTSGKKLSKEETDILCLLLEVI